MNFIKDGEKSNEHCLFLSCRDENWLDINTRFDGCTHLWMHYNADDSGGENTDYIHICDIDSMIESLREIKRLAKEYFGEGYNG